MVFGSLSSSLKEKNECLFLGAPEAEAEALPNSQMPLSKIYKDYNKLIPSLKHEKFIIVGRKGAGKSAFAEHICLHAKEDANLFAKFIRQGESNLEHIVQIGKDSGHEIERENLYKWLILTNILKLFSDNQAIENNKDYSLLKQFLLKNSGFIDIRESEIKEIVQKQGFDINIDYLKRFFKCKMNKSLEIRQEKAPFYKLIPHLKDVLTKVLTSQSELDNQNSYVLFFDDLDISFSANNKESVDSIISLLRVSKEINNDLFAKNNLNSKVIILLRDDISKSVATVSSDTAKIFSSYAVNINWYQNEYHSSKDEKELNIRKFINDRIMYAFKKAGLNANIDDPWLSLVKDPFNKNEIEHDKTSFKYILDHTLFRPRDILLFFKPLSAHKYDLPLSKQDINHLIGMYSEQLINELKNELCSFYSETQITTIFSAFGQMSKHLVSSKNIAYDEAISIINENCSGVEASLLLEDLYNRSLIGNMANNSYIYFKHREPLNDKYVFNKEYGIILHSALKVYCSKKGYSW